MVARDFGIFDIDGWSGDELAGQKALVSLPALEAAVPRVDRSKGQRPPFDAVLRLKVLILQTMQSPSHERTQYLMKDRLSFMRFLGPSLAEASVTARGLDVPRGAAESYHGPNASTKPTRLRLPVDARPDRRRDVCICVRSIQLEGAERGEQGGAYSRPLEGQVCEYWRRIMARHAGRSMTQPFPPLVARTVSLSSAKPGLIRNPTAAGLEAGHISMKCSTRRIRGWVSRHDLSIGQERRRARLCPAKPEGKAIEAQTPLRKKHVFGYEKGPIGFRRRPQVSRGQT